MLCTLACVCLDKLNAIQRFGLVGEIPSSASSLLRYFHSFYSYPLRFSAFVFSGTVRFTCHRCSRRTLFHLSRAYIHFHYILVFWACVWGFRVVSKVCKHMEIRSDIEIFLLGKKKNDSFKIQRTLDNSNLAVIRSPIFG